MDDGTHGDVNEDVRPDDTVQSLPDGNHPKLVDRISFHDRECATRDQELGSTPSPRGKSGRS